jgi:glycosyltransferase involved in cell wall biosynthesis
MKISVVIPTRNRAHLILRLCENIRAQTYSPSEIVIVDSSDEKEYKNRVIQNFPDLPILWIDSGPSVCIQRNKGIAMATSQWIFLCDDDIEVPPDYLEKLVGYASQHSDCGALSGLLLNLENGIWQDQYQVKKFEDLLWRFIFQLSIWGDFNSVKVPWLMQPMFAIIKKWNLRKRNTYTRAGWPLITNWSGESFKTKFYALGASLIRRDWLLQSPYDEVLDASGLGDNYGVALGFPGNEAIHVLTSTNAYHHKAKENRLAGQVAYYRRILALHYFIKLNKNDHVNMTASTAWLIWSLLGNVLFYLLKRNLPLAFTTLKAIGLICVGRNPYWIGNRKKKKVIQPVC